MKVIKYGPSCESKRIICGSCKSELEYIQKDIKYYDSKFEGSNYKQRFLEYIFCPVCEARIFTTTTPIENLEEKTNE